MIFNEGHRFNTKVQLDPQSVSDFAIRVGDHNPIHHDHDYAVTSRYGNLIASGPQTSAMMMSYTATYFSQFSPMVGLEFSFKFKSAVRADDEVKMEWMVIKSRKSKKFGGDIIELQGRMVDSSGNTAVGAKGKVLLSQKLG